MPGQEAGVVDHLHLMRWNRSPVPEDGIAVRLCGSGGEAWNDDSGATGCQKAIGHGPARRDKAPVHQAGPAAGEVSKVETQLVPDLSIRQIGEILAVHVIAAKRQRLCFERKTLLCFEPGRFKAQRGVKRRQADAVEPTPVQGCAGSRSGREGPARMVRSPYDLAKPHA